VALEALPSPPGKTFIVHQTFLAKRGVHVLETIDTNQLAADGVKEFLFVLGIPPLRRHGADGDQPSRDRLAAGMRERSRRWGCEVGWLGFQNA